MLGDHLSSMLFLHILSTAIMVGIIWVIQIVHYPSFHYIDKNRYVSFQNFHMNKISYIVIPVMSIEAISGIILLYNDQTVLFIISLIILLVIWTLTAFYFTRTHQLLASGYKKDIVRKLVQANWVRTGLWTLRLLILITYLDINLI